MKFGMKVTHNPISTHATFVASKVVRFRTQSLKKKTSDFGGCAIDIIQVELNKEGLVMFAPVYY